MTDNSVISIVHASAEEYIWENNSGSFPAIRVSFKLSEVPNDYWKQKMNERLNFQFFRLSAVLNDDVLYVHMYYYDTLEYYLGQVQKLIRRCNQEWKNQVERRIADEAKITKSASLSPEQRQRCLENVQSELKTTNFKEGM